ncbi:MAG: mannonate dehydratase [Rhodospirillaceae bacterium]|nr:mannonate dehydratase [Rhodospirillaceae bacterium]MCA8930904.1 mannonate dehydratase [Rhodospirillaceae bacterium]
MRETWRWFGPKDPIRISEVRQTGTAGIVSALHHLPAGVVWSPQEIAAHQRRISHDGGQPTGLAWEVVESLPVSEDIKRQTGPWRDHIAAWKQSLEHLAAAGIPTICYNFMPVLDWTRTALARPLPDGRACMAFDLIDFAVFDIYLLKRPGTDYEPAVVEEAGRWAKEMDDTARTALARNILCGLPGSVETLTLDTLKEHLALYGDITPERLRANMVEFLEEVTPLAEALGLRLCCHPDDPPFPLLGLPRVMSTEADYAAIMDAVDLTANGITLCSGSLGARPDNDLPGMMRRLGARVHFLHLRNVHRETAGPPCSFHESGHLEGDVDMVALIAEARAEEKRRVAAGRADANIPFRPDHGLDMPDDRGRLGQPGYPLVGRHVGLAELRGVIAALDRSAA